MRENIEKNFINKETEISYTLQGDYKIPNLVLEQQNNIILNKYGRARLKFLKENKKVEYGEMVINGTLNNHLKEVQEIAEKRINLIIKELTKQENITEKLKENTQIEWIKAMNNIKNRAEEIIYNEIIYSYK